MVLALGAGVGACGDDDPSDADTDAEMPSGDGDDGDGDGTGDGDGAMAGDGDGAPTPGAGCDAKSTWGAIQSTIFEGHGCTDAACHGKAAEGGLDLRPDSAYESLVRADSKAAVSMLRILPGEQEESLLYRKLAAKTLDVELPSASGAPMPVGSGMVPEDQLNALRIWIRGGAPETGVVLGTEALFSCDTPPEPTPLKVEPLEVPAKDEGFQLYNSGWFVDAHDEAEVCYATYYDVADQVPESARVPCSDRYGGPDAECVALNRFTILQDPQSHHLFVDVIGADDAKPDEPGWHGEFQCIGGKHDGMTCDPLAVGKSVTDGGADCGERSQCQTPAHVGVACNGWGPTGYQLGYALAGTGESRRSYRLNDGVYTILPLKGYVVWNSHAFNTTDESTTVEAYYNVYYAPREDQLYENQRLSDRDKIFRMNVAPYQKQELCETYTIPQYARLTGLTSHTHKWGVQWRTWLPPNEPCARMGECLPREDEPVYTNYDYSDPPLLGFDPPLEYDDADEASRTFLFCAVYDNGAENPDLLRRKSQSPAHPCMDMDLYCVGGDNPGDKCAGDGSVCTGGGVCDACPVRGGVTTDDEMFILQGGFYLKPPGE